MEDIKISVPDSVYPPLEDSQLLADVALKECSGRILEVGCGSGFVSITISKFKPDTKIICVDINSEAVKAAKKNSAVNGVKLKIFESDLFENVDVGSDFDWILFNPPYLPTSEAEKIDGGLNFAFDGGESGFDTVFRFLERAKDYLKKDGKVLLVVSTAQDLLVLNQKICDCGYLFEVMAQESFFFEKIYVYKLTQM